MAACVVDESVPLGEEGLINEELGVQSIDSYNVAPSAVDDGGVYNFGTLASPGKCLDVASSSTADGANIHSWQCNGTGAQSFRAENLGNGRIRLVNTSSSKCVDVASNGSADGTNIHQWTCNGTAAQSFVTQDVGGGEVAFVHPSSGKCIDVDGANTANGTNIQLWTCNGTNAQRWQPTLLSDPGNPPGGGWDSRPPRSDGKWVRVRNSCSFPIWIHGAGSSGVLQPDNQQLAPGATRDYVAPNEWHAARVTAYTDGPRQGELEKAEMTFTNGVLNFNVTYVDWVGLPLALAGIGGSCNASHVTGCYAHQADLVNGCPHGFLRDGNRCLSPRTYCSNPVNHG
ncbi:MAG: RICIN domain-containing protein, partial [Proteobacteria bacterium]|nr:RICIN domain-containing protein [Pseudomonadota bacterium]